MHCQILLKYKFWSTCHFGHSSITINVARDSNSVWLQFSTINNSAKQFTYSSAIHTYSFSKTNLTCNMNYEGQKAKFFIYAFTNETDIFISQYSHKIIK